MHPITVAGHICLDVAPSMLGHRGDAHAVSSTPEFWLHPGALREVGAARVTLGGAVANTGRALHDLGAPVSVSTTIGDDILGRVTRDLIDQSGFAATSVQVTSDWSTSYSVVVEPPEADRTFWHHVGANAAFDGTALEPRTGILHVGYPTLLPRLLEDSGHGLETLLRRAKKGGVTSSVDLAVYDRDSGGALVDWERVFTSTAPWTDLLTPSLDDLTSALGIAESYSESLVEELAQRFIDAGVAVVAISSGRHGLHVRTGSPDRLRRGGAALAAVADTWAQHSITRSAIQVRAHATTNGAGDASTAGFLFGLARGRSLDESTRLAIASAAAVVGGQRPTPTILTDLDSSLSSCFEGHVK
ncbi:carbohydrate kinase family protein [Agromyces marinus]|uniref:Carbohydrate kinase PfkB domain-containing protein n=1 Tax=Agromyces marinus TaxID=1389020 RepID=A0ABM8H4M2_9MICO|nr:carbohydrate kinase family protein [Agromyces marinus]UIP59238.1 Ribokinase [Agromyces marinus]BDZ55752.1 hypothetical protein GCM10025870_28250 [Agromyces marinus]